MRELTEDEIIHVPLRYIQKYGIMVPDTMPVLTEHNCISLLRKLVKEDVTSRPPVPPKAPPSADATQ